MKNLQLNNLANKEYASDHLKRRFIFFAVILLFILAALVLSISWLHQSEEKRVIKEQTELVTAHLETVVDDLISDTKNILTLLSQQYTNSPETCDKSLRHYVNEYDVNHIYTGIGVLNSSGQLLCSSFVDTDPGLIKRKLQVEYSQFDGRTLLINEFRFGDVTHKYILPIALNIKPFTNRDEYISASVSRHTFQRQLDRMSLPEYMATFIISSSGDVVAARHELGSEYWFQQGVKNTPLFKKLNLITNGYFEGGGFDGKERGISFKQVKTLGEPFYIVSTYDNSAIQSGFLAKSQNNRMIIIGIVILSCFSLLTLSYFLFIKIIYSLNNIAKEVADDLLENEFNDEFAKSIALIEKTKGPVVSKIANLLHYIRSTLDSRNSELEQIGKLTKLVRWRAFKSNGQIQFGFGINNFFANKTINSLYDIDWVDSIVEGDRSKYLNNLEKLFNDNKKANFEFRVKSGDITYFVEFRGAPTGAYSADKYVGTLQDVTEEKRFSLELDESRRFLRTVLDNLGESVIACDVNGNLKEFNAVSEEFHGLTSANVSKDELAEYYSLYKEDGSRLLKTNEIPLIRALNGESFSEEKLLIAPKNKPKRTVIVRGQPIINKNGKKIGAVVVQRDISDFLQAQSKIRQREQEFEAIFEANADGLIVVDDNFDVVLMNRSTLKLYDFEGDELIGQPIVKLFHELSNRDLQLTAKKDKPLEITSKNKSGDPIPVDLRVTEITLRGKSAFLLIIRDQREKKKIERRISQLQRMDAISRLTGGIAHDFNNLLQVIVMNLEVLEEEVSEDKEILQLVRSALNSANRGGNLVAHLLTFTRQQRYVKEDLDINTLIEESKVLIDSIISRKITVNYILDPGSPICCVDKSQLEMAISQVLINADEAISGAGTISFRTSIIRQIKPKIFAGKLLPVGDYCQISISDDGKGMTEHEVGHAFEPFYTTKKLGQSSGLGLSMVYGFIQESNGAIYINSELDKGTTVEILLPLVGSK